MQRETALVGDMRLFEEIPSRDRRPHQTEEVMFMEHEASPNQAGARAVKTLAIRLDQEQHAQLSMIAQLEELTITDAIRDAIDRWVDSKRNNPQLQQRAEAVLESIEQEAATRRGAIAALLSEPPPKAAKSGAGRGGRRPASPSAHAGGGELIPGYL